MIIVPIPSNHLVHIETKQDAKFRQMIRFFMYDPQNERSYAAYELFDSNSFSFPTPTNMDMELRIDHFWSSGGDWQSSREEKLTSDVNNNTVTMEFEDGSPYMGGFDLHVTVIKEENIILRPT